MGKVTSVFKLLFTITAIVLIQTSCKKDSKIVPDIPPLIVNDANLNGWVKHQVGTATVGFSNSPSTRLLGNGTALFTTAPNHTVSSFARLRNTQYTGILLSTITELSYSTYIEHRDSAVDSHFVTLLMDINGDAIVDHPLNFFPWYQTSSYVAGIVPTQSITKENIWQTWDALHGGWFIFTGVQNDPDHGGEILSLATYIRRYPNATIQNDATGGGGIRLTVGGGFKSNFIGYADNFKIGINGVITTYDFEN